MYRCCPLLADSVFGGMAELDHHMRLWIVDNQEIMNNVLASGLRLDIDNLVP
jgi:hypothetical protein